MWHSSKTAQYQPLPLESKEDGAPELYLPKQSQLRLHLFYLLAFLAVVGVSILSFFAGRYSATEGALSWDSLPGLT